MKSIAVGGKFQIVLLHEVKVLIAIGGKPRILLTQVSNHNNKSNILLKTYNTFKNVQYNNTKVLMGIFHPYTIRLCVGKSIMTNNSRTLVQLK